LPELICNTSVMQSLHQLGLLDILPALGSPVCVPAAVCAELAAGRALGADVPDPATLTWATTRSPQATPALPQSTSLGAGLIFGYRAVVPVAGVFPHGLFIEVRLFGKCGQKRPDLSGRSARPDGPAVRQLPGAQH